MATKTKSEMNKLRHAFLKTLFPIREDKYDTVEINGFVLVRQFNRGNGEWEVAIYTHDNFAKAQNYIRKEPPNC